MNLPFRLDGTFLALYAGIYYVFHLAASYLGGIFGYVSRFLFVLLVLDLAHLLLSFNRLRYSQNFSTTHPVKGQNVEYIFRLRLESPIPGARLRVTFKGIRQELRLDYGVKTLDFFPGAGASEEHRKTVQCPFRGTYTVGLDTLELQDALALFWIKVPVWFITFYVYPRVIELESCRLGGEGKRDLATSLAEGTVVDPTRFRSLTAYRPGESTRHLAWKKFAVTGVPFLREWERSAFPGVTLYLDTLRYGEADYQSLLAEDCALEILLALARWFMRQGTPVYLRGEAGITRLGVESAAFSSFVTNTAKIDFCPRNETGRPCLIRDLESDIHGGILSTVSVVGIFRSFDIDVVSFLENYSDQYRHCYAILVVSALKPQEFARASAYRAFSPRSNRLILVHDADSIREDLL